MVTASGQGGRALLALLGVLTAQTEASRHRLQRWQPPVQTQALSLHDRAHLQTSPKPTDSPKVDLNQLFQREAIGSNTCGFLTDDRSAFPCDDGYQCANSGSFRGCCADDECSTSVFSTVCLDSTEAACSSYTPGTMCCTSESQYPYCVTYLWATSASPNQVFSLFVCDVDTYKGQQILDSEPNQTTSSDAGTTTSDSATNSDAPRPSAAPNTGDGDDNGSTARTGAIVGGVVGGLALIGAVVLGVVYMFFRNRRKSRNNDDNNNNGNGAAGIASNNTPGAPPGDMSMYAPSSYGAPSGYQPVSMYGPPPPPGHEGPDNYAYQDPSKQYGQQYSQELAGQQVTPPPAQEAPAQNAVGFGANRAELPP